MEEFKKDKLNLVGIEDVTTTWGSVVRAVQAVSSANKTFYGIETEALALQSFAHRKSDSVASHEAPRLSLLNLDLEQVAADQCGSCNDGVPLTQGAGEPVNWLI